MRYSRPVRIVFGILFFAIIFWYEGMWYQNSVMGSEFEAAAKLNAELREQRRLEDEAEDEAESGIVVESATETQATPEPTLRPEEDKAAVLGLPSPPEIDRNEFQYVLVNGDHPLDPITYEPQNLAYLNMTGDDTDIRTEYDGNRQVVDALIAQPLVDMVQACKAAGLPVYLSSGYRSYEIQRQNFERVCANNGISDGKNAEGNYITMPAGHSEHQTGLCVDITDRYYEVKNDDKRDITHVMSESWHFRYVGADAAKYIMDNNLCLEEFLALYGVE